MDFRINLTEYQPWVVRPGSSSHFRGYHSFQYCLSQDANWMRLIFESDVNTGEESLFLISTHVISSFVCDLDFIMMIQSSIINSQSLEDTQVVHISQKYSFDKCTLGGAFKPSYTIASI